MSETQIIIANHTRRKVGVCLRVISESVYRHGELESGHSVEIRYKPNTADYQEIKAVVIELYDYMDNEEKKKG